MNHIRMNDGTDYPVEFCGEDDGVCGFRLAREGTAAEMAAAFGDPAVTETITYLMPNPMAPDQPTVLAVYEGYTDLIGILIDRNSRRPLIQLQKEERNAT